MQIGHLNGRSEERDSRLRAKCGGKRPTLGRWCAADTMHPNRSEIPSMQSLIYIMIHDFSSVKLPVGASGYGRFGGKAGIDSFTELRWITIETQPGHYPI